VNLSSILSPSGDMRRLSRLYRIAANARPYVRALGPWTGLHAFYALHRDADVPVPVRVGTGAPPLWARPRSSDVETFEQVFIDREYDTPLPFSPELILDGGANVGCASVYFARRYPRARIIAVEPDPSNAALLRRNVASYPVEVIQAGIWSRQTHLRIENPGDDFWAFRVIESEPGPDTLPAVTIAELLERSGADRIDVLKLDIEGAEREVLTDGYRDWIEHVRVLVVELHDRFRPGCREALEAAVRGRGFRREVRGENVFLMRD